MHGVTMKFSGINSHIVLHVAVTSHFVITTSSKNIAVLRDPTPCTLLQEHRRFIRTCYLRH